MVQIPLLMKLCTSNHLMYPISPCVPNVVSFYEMKGVGADEILGYAGIKK